MNFNVRPLLTLVFRFGSLPLALILMGWAGQLFIQQFVLDGQTPLVQSILPPADPYQVWIVHFILSLLALSAVLIVAFLATRADPAETLDGISNNLKQGVSDTRKDVQLMSARLETLDGKVSELKLDNARFVHLGFIGLQEAACDIERIRKEYAPLRYAISRHLPSHVRERELSLEEARPLYNMWEPANRLRDYVRLINQRWNEQNTFIEAGGECWEFFSKQDLQGYALEGSTPFDSTEDSIQERLSRFRRLESLLGRENYHLCLLHQAPSISLLLRTSSGAATPVASDALLLDLRLPHSQTNFEESSYGVVTRHSETVQAYKRRVDRMLNQAQQRGQADADKAALRALVGSWVKGLEERLQSATAAS